MLEISTRAPDDHKKKLGLNCPHSAATHIDGCDVSRQGFGLRREALPNRRAHGVELPFADTLGRRKGGELGRQKMASRNLDLSDMGWQKRISERSKLACTSSR